MKENYFIKHPVILVTTIIWLGFILAISFMEAWLKFRAPGVTLPVGLGIGRLVFFVLNKIEWVFLLISLYPFFFVRSNMGRPQLIIVLLLATILLLQTFWLLPNLDARAQLIIQGTSPTSSFLHLFYVVGEIIKVAALIFLTTIQFNKTT